MGRRKEGLSGLAVALIQLPVPDPDPTASRANVPLAAGYLKASLQAAQIDAGQGSPAFSAASADIRVIPRTLANRGGDAAILRWVHSLGPSLTGFSASMWNIQRNLWFAERIKAADPGILVLMGGPEIVAGAAVLDSPFVDSFAVGEGGAAFVETMRGCAHRCSYCHCAKALPGLRSVEVGLQSTNARALRAVNWAWRKDAFARGAELLRQEGIVVKTGIILGLPEDTPEDFAATVDFLAALGGHRHSHHERGGSPCGDPRSRGQAWGRALPARGSAPPQHPC